MLVKKYRKQKKLTQKEVAQKIGINERQYQRIEAGESFATQKVLNALEDL
ncbi:helix-turn-helix domain-containing protein, partial [Enterococcus faecium]|nr:helix-turn-helix domain-containing protein [Enterococcus faecium]